MLALFVFVNIFLEDFMLLEELYSNFHTSAGIARFLKTTRTTVANWKRAGKVPKCREMYIRARLKDYLSKQAACPAVEALSADAPSNHPA